MSSAGLSAGELWLELELRGSGRLPPPASPHSAGGTDGEREGEMVARNQPLNSECLLNQREKERDRKRERGKKGEREREMTGKEKNTAEL